MLYQRIARAMAERIAAGRYKPGERIPAIREMAEEFDCNKLTVQKAYHELRQQGLIDNRVGSGSFVRFPEQILKPAGFYDFRTDYIAEALFPYATAQKLLNELFDTEKARALAPAPASGDPELIKVLSGYYRVPAERMLMISGAQQGLDLIAKVFAARISDSILFEDPTYPGAISLFKARHFVSMDADGPNLADLDRRLAGGIRLFYAMPAVHNPTGASYSLRKKKAVAERARRQPFYIIEDDYLSELNPKSAPRLVDLAPEQTLYIKSLSQTTVAGFRIGFMVTPQDLYDRFVSAKYFSDIASSGLIQKLMRRFIRQGHYDAHLSAVKARAEDRRARLLALIQGHAHLSAADNQMGYGLWVRSTRPPASDQVPWRGGEAFSFTPELKNCFHIAFMHMDDPEFEEGLTYLDGMFQRMG